MNCFYGLMEIIVGIYSMAKKILRAFIDLFSELVFKIEYGIEAWFHYATHIIAGGSPSKRLFRYPVGQFDAMPSALKSRLALFVACHPDADQLSESNRQYLMSLLRCGFRILYIHNGPLTDRLRIQLGEYCETVFCRQNIGQDFGAWKDACLFVHEYNLLDPVDWLLLCNDSNFFLGSPQALSFEQKFKAALASQDDDLIALNKNYELWQHYQSFFLCFHKSLFWRPAFLRFWQDYRPLSHRYRIIKKGEVELTRSVINNAKVFILYQSSDLLSHFRLFEQNPIDFYSCLPQSSLYLADFISGEYSINELHLQKILALLDNHNTSHVYALCFVAFLQSPFLKKDLLSKGIFSMPQLCSVLRFIRLEEAHPCLYREIMNTYDLQGTNASYIWRSRLALERALYRAPSCYLVMVNF